MSGGDLIALAERCEQATRAERRLDADIAVAISGDANAWAVLPSPESMFSHQPGWYRAGDDKSHCAPEYTRFLDAATGLFPEETFYRSGHDGAGPDVTLFYCEAIGTDTDGWPLPSRRSIALTEPLARVACALKVLAQVSAASELSPAHGSTLHGIEAAGGDVGGAG